jgi:hypothetical protein
MPKSWCSSRLALLGSSGSRNAASLANISPLRGLRKGLQRHTSTGIVSGGAATRGIESVLAQFKGGR